MPRTGTAAGPSFMCGFEFSQCLVEMLKNNSGNPFGREILYF